MTPSSRSIPRPIGTATAIATPMVLIPALVLVVGGWAVAAGRVPPPALVNESASLPRGLYLRSFDQAIEPGEVVALPQPANARPYLRSLGMPGEILLIKRVSAGPGERVCGRDGVVATPRRTAIVRERDRRGRRLPVWRGCRRLGPGEVFVLGDTASSFDSRYFGPVRRSALTGVYKEAITW